MATIENVKFTIANLKSEYATIADKYEGKIAEMRETMLNEQAVLVANTHLKGGFSDVTIGEALGMTKGNVGKVIARGVAVMHGFSGTATQQAIDTAGNDVTVGALKRIGKQKMSKSEKVELLENLGVPSVAKSAEPRQTKTTAEKTEADIKTLEAIFARAVDGKTTLALIYAEIARIESIMGDMK